MISRKLKISFMMAVAAAVILSGSFGAFQGIAPVSHATPQPSSGTVASAGYRAVPVTLYNNQSVATASPYQMELTVDSALYSSHEAANLSNVEFTYANGPVIPSWLESGNSNTAAVSVYWLNLSAGIPAHSTLQIYMAFLPAGQIAFNGHNVGEAAQLSGAQGSPSYGIYNDIASVMSPGLIYQMYVNNDGQTSISESAIAGASILDGYTVPNTGNLKSTTNPFTTAVSGTSQNVDGTTESNVILNYQYEYSGGISFPDPPVAYPSNVFSVKAIGWVNVPQPSVTINTLADDGIFVGTSTTGGSATGMNWVSQSNSKGIINEWIPESATHHPGTLTSGTIRIQIGYYNQGGQAYLGVSTTLPITYYHAAPSPDGVLPGVSFGSMTDMYGLTFVPGGLTPSSQWSVSLSSTEVNVTANGNSDIQYVLSNGTYSYSVKSLNSSFNPVAASGIITISGNSESLAVAFAPVLYKVTVHETASSLLPAGTQWNVTVMGQMPQSKSTTSNYTTFELVNGTYSIEFASSDSHYQASGSQFTLSGANLSLSVDFTSAFAVNLSESGLPAGTEWYVNFSNLLSFNSTTSVVHAYEINGSFTYRAATADKKYEAPGGSVTVSGASLNISVAFSPVLYSITIAVSGLPVSEQFYINVSTGASFNGTVTPDSFGMLLQNGTYSYTAAIQDPMFEAPSASFTVDGSSMTINVVYSLVTYNVNFTVAGIPAGVYWYVNVSNVSYYSTPTWANLTSDVSYVNSLNLPNGTYTFSLQSGNKIYSPVAYSPGLKVSGGNVTVALSFYVYTYTVNISAAGLPSGATWYLNGSSGNISSSGLLSLQMHNGTYSYTPAASAFGYTPFPGTVTFDVLGHSENITVNFVPSTTSVTITIENLSSSVTTWYLNISNGESLTVHGQSVTFNLPYGDYTYTISVAGHGIVYSGSLSLNTSTVSIEVNLAQPLSPSGATSGQYGDVMAQSSGMAFAREVIQ